MSRWAAFGLVGLLAGCFGHRRDGGGGDLQPQDGVSQEEQCGALWAHTEADLDVCQEITLGSQVCDLCESGREDWMPSGDLEICQGRVPDDSYDSGYRSEIGVATCSRLLGYGCCAAL